MRFSGGFLLLSLIAVGVMLYLGKLDISFTTNAVTAIASDLREHDVDGAVFDDAAARQMIGAMETLVADPDSIADHLDDLKTFSAAAASWAAEAAVASPELHAAVMLRRAAGSLRSYGTSANGRHLVQARRYLDAATATLDGDRSGGDSAFGPGPGHAVGAIRDQIENLEQSHQEKIQEVDEELSQPDRDPQ